MALTNPGNVPCQSGAWPFDGLGAVLVQVCAEPQHQKQGLLDFDSQRTFLDLPKVEGPWASCGFISGVSNLRSRCLRDHMLFGASGCLIKLITGRSKKSAL